MANDRNVNLISNHNNNDNNNSSKPLTYAAIGDERIIFLKRLFKAHYKNLQNQSDYLFELQKRIAQVSNLEDKENQSLLAEVKQYLWEQNTPLINCNKLFISTLIRKFHHNLNVSLNLVKMIYGHIKTINQIDTMLLNGAIDKNMTIKRNKAILFVTYIAKILLTGAAGKKSLQDATVSSLEDKIIGSYHDFALYNKLFEEFNAIIPDQFLPQFNDIFTTKISNQKKGTERKKALCTKIDWEFLFDDLRKKAKHNFTFSDEERNKIKIYENLLKKFWSEHAAYLANQENVEEHTKEFEKNIDYFLKINDLIIYVQKTLCNPIEREFNCEKIQTARQEFNHRVITGFLTKWLDTHKEIIANIENLKLDVVDELRPEVEAAEILANSATEEFNNAFKENWKAQIGDTYSTIEVKELYESFQEYYQNSLREFNQVKKQVNQLREESKQLREKKVEDAKKKQQEILAQIKQEREKFKQSLQEMQNERTQKLNGFRVEQAKAKEERQTKIKEERAKLIAKKPKEVFVQYQNLDMLECIKQLNHQKMEILKSIFDNNAAVYYTDIVNLITNDFGGKVLEIGNGSSHKRILINKLIIELPEQDKEQQIEAQSVTTGGFFNPHVKGHNPGLLSHCNIKLVRETFEKAGITLVAIQKLEDDNIPKPNF